MNNKVQKIGFLTKFVLKQPTNLNLQRDICTTQILNVLLLTRNPTAHPFWPSLIRHGNLSSSSQSCALSFPLASFSGRVHLLRGGEADTKWHRTQEWGGEGTRLELRPERRRWEVCDCPRLKGSVKRRSLLQKAGGPGCRPVELWWCVWLCLWVWRAGGGGMMTKTRD